MFNFWFCFVGVVSLLLYIVWLIPKVTSQPSRPPNWPIVRSLFYLCKLPHHSMEELVEKYGPIIYLHLGYLDHIIISNAEMAMEVLKIFDVDFVSRPHNNMLASKYAGFDWSNIFFAPYGDHWRLLCKICITKLFTKTRLKGFEPRHQYEMAYMVKTLTSIVKKGNL